MFSARPRVQGTYFYAQITISPREELRIWFSVNPTDGASKIAMCKMRGGRRARDVISIVPDDIPVLLDFIVSGNAQLYYGDMKLMRIDGRILITTGYPRPKAITVPPQQENDVVQLFVDAHEMTSKVFKALHHN